jgi:hypothetical protein
VWINGNAELRQMTMADAELGRGRKEIRLRFWRNYPESEELHNPSPTVLFNGVEQNAFRFWGSRRLQR